MVTGVPLLLQEAGRSRSILGEESEVVEVIGFRDLQVVLWVTIHLETELRQGVAGITDALVGEVR